MHGETLDSQPGIESVISGYTGGHGKSITRNGGTTGHTEVVQITFDPEVVPYEKLVKSAGNKRTQRMQWDNSWTVEIHTARLSSIIPEQRKLLSFKGNLASGGRFKKIS